MASSIVGLSYYHAQVAQRGSIMSTIDQYARRLSPIILALSAAFATAAQAQQPYPSKPIRLVVPYAAGGITDVIARALGQRLTEAWRQPVVVENKPGGGAGQVGAEYAARSAPDG